MKRMPFGADTLVIPFDIVGNTREQRLVTGMSRLENVDARRSESGTADAVSSALDPAGGEKALGSTVEDVR